MLEGNGGAMRRLLSLFYFLNVVFVVIKLHRHQKHVGEKHKQPVGVLWGLELRGK